jgi:phage/conjugal plasmid C-4 type zinc finger TraR family protein
MAGGWARDGAVNEQIEDELTRMELRRRQASVPSRSHCAECEEAIPKARREALPGVQLCVDCQAERDAAPVPRGGIIRRGSKDSQLKMAWPPTPLSSPDLLDHASAAGSDFCRLIAPILCQPCPPTDRYRCLAFRLA